MSEPRSTVPEDPPRVLVVDDEVRIARALRRVLAGHVVVATCDGRDALRLLLAGESRFDVVLCDVVMPGVGGVELWRAIELQKPELLPSIVFMTGGATSPRDQKFLDAHDGPIVDKPFCSTELRVLVRDVATRGRRRAP